MTNQLSEITEYTPTGENEEDAAPPPEEIAIVGMTGRFPGAPDLESFWENLRAGRETITRFDGADREAERNPNYVPARGVLGDGECFDAAFFGVSPHEALVTDPQHRVFLEAAWSTLEAAGCDPKRYQGAIGVYAGMSNNTYFDGAVRARPDLVQSVGPMQTMIGNEKDYLATRVSYKLNLTGPSVSVHTACSTSLVAVCQACAALLSYQCDMALAGGVSITYPIDKGYVYHEGGITSPDGHCRAFDARAHGTVFSSGVGVVALKRLSDAIADGDTICAVIKGSALNNDGARKSGFTAPSVEGHAEVIALAQAVAGVDARTISYIEAHGTGTPLGDPIEVAGLTLAFRQNGASEQGFCALGSVKANIGHLDAAAGVAGLIKTVLALQHRELPPTLHFETANPKLSLETSPFYVQAALAPWVATGNTPLRAGVSSFGVGGTNAHVVLEEAPAPTVRTDEAAARSFHLLPLSAKTNDALERATANLAAYLDGPAPAPLADVAYTLGAGRQEMGYRRFVVAQSASEAAALLRSGDTKRVFSGVTDKDEAASPPPVAFLFPGQGVQHVDMGRALYETEPVFRASVDESAEILRPLLGGLDLRAVLYPGADDAAARTDAQTRLTETWLTQPALFVAEYALARLWLSLGIRPAALLGHSVGEYVAACVAGVFSHEDGLRLLARRARLMQDTPPGAMLAVRLPEADAVARLTPDLSLAAVNASNLCVVSGPNDAVEALERRLADEKIVSRRLATSHAFHSQMMDSVLPPFAELLRTVRFAPPQIPLVSSLTGTFLTSDEATDPAYWTRQLREAVRFADGVETLLGATGVCLETGPGQTLSALVRQHPAKTNAHAVISSLPAAGSAQSDAAAFREAVGRLWLRGVAPDWVSTFAGETPPRRVPLPTYPFERTLFRIEPPQELVATAEAPPAPIAEEASLAPNTRGTEGEERRDDVHVTHSPSTIEGGEGVLVVAAPNRKARLQTELQTVLHELSGYAPDKLAPDATFLELGFDSLFLTQASQTFGRRFGVRVTFRTLMEDAPTLAALAEYVDAQLPPDPVAETVAPVETPAPLSAPVAASAQRNPGSPSNENGAGTALERVIQQQLQVMAQQLEALRGGGGVPAGDAPAPPPLSSTVAGTPAVEAVAPVVAAPAPAHGPFRPFRPSERGASDLTPTQQAGLDDLIARYTERTGGSKRLTAEHRAHLADPRVVAGFRQTWKEMVYPIVAERSDGAFIWDVDGNEYVDVTLGFGANFLGHRPPFVVRAVEAQLARGMEIGPQSPLAGQVAEKICRISGMDRAAFCNTGSEAVTAALRIARTVTGRDKIVLFAGSYHGQFDEVLVRAAGTVNGEPRALPIAPGIPHAMAQNVTVLEYGTDESLEALRRLGPELAAVLVEPVQSRHPDLQPQAFLHEVRRITEASGTALIFDEVVTGFRSHLNGVQGLYGIKADIATYGKVVGGGLPIGVVTGKARFMDALDGGAWAYGDDSFPEAGVTFFAGTFVRHPLALAAADAVLDHLEAHSPQLQNDLDAKTAYLAERLQDVFARANAPYRVARFSSLLYLQAAPDAKHASLLYFHLRLRGVHIWEGRPLFLSIAHTDTDIERIVAAFRDSVAEMAETGFLPAPPVAEATLAPLDAARPAPEITPSQREIWLAARFSPSASCAFNESLVLDLRGPLDAEAMETALHRLVDRHDALRTTFADADGQPAVAPHVVVPLARLDLRGESEADRARRFDEVAGEEGVRPFDLANGPLFRATLVALEDEHHALVVSAHHLVCDGWSYGVLLREWGELYTAARAGVAGNLPPAPRFGDYATREQETGAEQNADTEAFWLDLLNPPPPPLPLPTDRPYPPVRTYRGGRISKAISREQADALKRLGAKQGATLFTTLLTAMGVLLARLSGETDVVIGVPVAGQATAGVPQLVGHCVHSLPLRLPVDLDAPFSAQLKTVRGATLAAFEHPQITIGELLPKLSVAREGGRAPLVGVTFNLDRDDARQDFAGLTLAVDKAPRHFFQFDLGVNVVESENGLLVEASFNGDVLDEETVVRWLGYYETLLAGALANAETTVSALPLLTAQERADLLALGNDTDRAYPRDQNIADLFAAWAARTPDAVAVQSEDGGEQLTYGELNRRANRLAHYLRRSTGVGAGDFVGICVHRSVSMVVGLLAILKTGAAYVPLDPSHPNERLQYLLNDSGARVVLSENALAARLPDHGDVLCLDGDANLFGGDDADKANAPVLPISTSGGGDVACLIYTSGSTGNPKGVEVPHRAISRLVINTNYVQFAPGDMVGQTATLTFDAATFEIWGALLNGARIVILTNDLLLSPQRFARYLERNHITTLFLTTALLNETVREVPAAFRNVRYLMFGGEAASPETIRALLAAGPPAHLLNGYGPTEATTFALFHEVRTLASDAQSVPIGLPIANTDVYLLDENREPVPFGVWGEIYIGGDGLARGYHNQPDRTAEGFVPHPFRDGARLYRTGDLARRLPGGGVYDFIGRRDDQVKIRGFRIEPGEIEAAIRQHPDVRDALVLAVDDARGTGDKRLVAYVLSANPAKPDAATCDELRRFVQGRLPSFMTPSAFITLATFPLTPNGKVDRKALPSPDDTVCNGANNDERTGPVAPRDDTEARVAKIWRDVLKTDVGVHDEFFAVGGHSLLAVRLFARIETEFGRGLPLSALFQAPTIAQQAEMLRPYLLMTSGDTPLATIAAPVWESLAPMRTEGDRPVLFCVHHGYGDLTGYQDLISSLGNDQPVWGLQARGIDGKNEPFERIEEMAAHYLREIRAFQPHGPYHLTGFSLGGVIAFEMARQLQDANQSVGMVALLDTYAPAYFRGPGDGDNNSAPSLLHELTAMAGDLRRVAPGERWRFTRNKGKVAQDRLRNLLRRPQATAEAAARRVAAPEESRLEAAIRHVERASRKAVRAYMPLPYDGAVVLFRAREREVVVGFDPVLWWREVIGGGVQVIEIPGDHHKIIQEPGVHVLARALRDQIDRAEAVAAPVR